MSRGFWYYYTPLQNGQHPLPPGAEILLFFFSIFIIFFLFFFDFRVEAVYRWVSRALGSEGYKSVLVSW